MSRPRAKALWLRTLLCKSMRSQAGAQGWPMCHPSLAGKCKPCVRTPQLTGCHRGTVVSAALGLHNQAATTKGRAHKKATKKPRFLRTGRRQAKVRDTGSGSLTWGCNGCVQGTPKVTDSSRHIKMKNVCGAGRTDHEAEPGRS